MCNLGFYFTCIFSILKKYKLLNFLKIKDAQSECFLFDSNRSLFSYHHLHSHTESTESSGKEKQKMPKKKL